MSQLFICVVQWIIPNIQFFPCNKTRYCAFIHRVKITEKRHIITCGSVVFSQIMLKYSYLNKKTAMIINDTTMATAAATIVITLWNNPFTSWSVFTMGSLGHTPTVEQSSRSSSHGGRGGGGRSKRGGPQRSSQWA